jgi:hypothetical protein
MRAFMSLSEENRPELHQPKTFRYAGFRERNNNKTRTQAYFLPPPTGAPSTAVAKASMLRKVDRPTKMAKRKKRGPENNQIDVQEERWEARSEWIMALIGIYSASTKPRSVPQASLRARGTGIGAGAAGLD